MRQVVKKLPAAPGVYRFVDERGRALYVGRAVDLRRRVASYWGRLRDRPRLRRMVKRISRIDALVCDSGHEAAWLERNVLARSRPPWNRAVGGQEVPLFIALDANGGALRTAYDTAAEYSFGPYLGGAQVRLAISALQRVLPLRYTAGRLTAAERDLAAARGLVLTDRPGMVDRALAVLRREPAAVTTLRQDLAARRDLAARALAFELAAQIQAEIGAIEWISAEQRVTSQVAVDVDGYGYLDGLLLQLVVRAGRLEAWRVRESAAVTAASLVAATPAAWQPFAQRNVELAVALRTP